MRRHMRSAGKAYLGEGLLEEVAGALKFGAAIALHELLQVGQPNVAHMWVFEERHTPLIHPERLLPVLVLLCT